MFGVTQTDFGWEQIESIDLRDGVGIVLEGAQVDTISTAAGLSVLATFRITSATVVWTLAWGVSDRPAPPSTQSGSTHLA